MTHDPARSDHSCARHGACGALCARAVRRDPVRFGAAAVCRATDVHQNGAAKPWRRAVGVVGRDGLLPGGAAGRLCLRASVGADAHGRAGRARPSCRSRGRGADPAHRHRARLRHAAVGRHRIMVDRAVCGLDRIAVRGAVGQRSAAAKLVRRKRAPPGAQSLCALCSFEPRLVHGAARLSAGS